MKKKKRLKIEDEEQSARFKRTAERIQEEGAEKKFEKAIKQILSVEPEGRDGTEPDNIT